MGEKIHTCPMCGKAMAGRYRPFCSKRCADHDLGRWLAGDYRLPSMEPDDPDEIEELIEAIEEELAAGGPDGGRLH